MTQEAHTQGPWRFVPWHIEEGSSAVRAPDGHLICSTASDANARRIVGCVNALAGIPIEAIESGVVAEALLAVVNATRAYLPPDGISEQECINRILEATDNPKINPVIAAWEASK